MFRRTSFIVIKTGAAFKALWRSTVSDSPEDNIDHFKLRQRNVRKEIMFVWVTHKLTSDRKNRTMIICSLIAAAGAVVVALLK